MKWIQFEGTTFDLSKVTHFGINNFLPGNDDRYQIEAFLNFSSAWNADGEVFRERQRTLVVGGYGTKSSREKAIRDIIAGEYDLPDQSQFIALSAAGGYETAYINVNHIVHASDGMGGLSLTMVDGKVFSLYAMHGNKTPHDKAESFILDDISRVYRAFGGTSYGWETKQYRKAREAKEDSSGEGALLLVLQPTGLKWNYDRVYESQVGGVSMFWVIRKDDEVYKAHPLLLGGKQITCDTIEGLKDMASEMAEGAFAGTVRFEPIDWNPDNDKGVE